MGKGCYCYDKKYCCFCCAIGTGIKVLGLWLLAECLLNLLALFTRNPPQPVSDSISVILSLIIVGFFFWSFCNERSLKARQYWFIIMIVDFIIHTVMTVIMLVHLNFTNFARDDWCQRYALDNGYAVTVDGDYVQQERGANPILYKNVDQCAGSIKMTASGIILGVFVLYALLRVWFIINVRDWRDELAAREAKGDAAVTVEMQTDRQIAPKPADAQPAGVPVGQPLYQQVDPSQTKANGM